uniref:Uncharacterized protein n=1 Tax=Pseudomonas aeruginosa TaxID=287 RepID=A0A2L1KG80_PSEAI|nr:Hypothetical protein [Pseudomonas aeruginosa]QLG05203.1 hypothetical protein [Pseudomonas aeruginosa]
MRLSGRPCREVNLWMKTTWLARSSTPRIAWFERPGIRRRVL